jgi:adenylate kinase
MKVIMLGAPGAGKGTQAKKIAAKYGVPHISTGDILRENIKNKTQLGLKAKVYMDQGLLVADDLVLELVVARFKLSDCKNGYVLDGFPRTIPQATALDAKLDKKNDRIEYAIDVYVADEVIVNRMAGRRACLNCGRTYHVDTLKPKLEGICDYCDTNLVLRDDDKPETVIKRLEVYHEQTKPLLEYYEKKGILHRVDGTESIDNIYKEIIHILEA